VNVLVVEAAGTAPASSTALSHHQRYSYIYTVILFVWNINYSQNRLPDLDQDLDQDSEPDQEPDLDPDLDQDQNPDSDLDSDLDPDLDLILFVWNIKHPSFQNWPAT